MDKSIFAPQFPQNSSILKRCEFKLKILLFHTDTPTGETKEFPFRTVRGNQHMIQYLMGCISVFSGTLKSIPGQNRIFRVRV
jgi:hypothetical protein